MNDFEESIEGLAAVGLGVYLAVVIIRGNLKPLLSELTYETGFLEFIVALFILYEVLKVKELRPFSVPLSAAVVIILAMRLIQGSDVSLFQQFAKGQIGLFDLFGKVIGSQA